MRKKLDDHYKTRAADLRCGASRPRRKAGQGHAVSRAEHYCLRPLFTPAV